MKWWGLIRRMPQAKAKKGGCHEGRGVTATPPEFRSYDRLFAAADELGVSYAEKEQLFARMAFNVLCGECDDHVKNFSFMLAVADRFAIGTAPRVLKGVKKAFR